MQPSWAKDVSPLHRIAKPLTGSHTLSVVGANNYSPILERCRAKRPRAKDLSPLQGMKCIHVTLSGVEGDMGSNPRSGYVRVDEIKPSPNRLPWRWKGRAGSAGPYSDRAVSFVSIPSREGSAQPGEGPAVDVRTTRVLTCYYCWIGDTWIQDWCNWLRAPSTGLQAIRPSRFSASMRVAVLRIMPRIAEVTILLPGFLIPRMVRHRCSASTTTSTPLQSIAATMASAI